MANVIAYYQTFKPPLARDVIRALDRLIVSSIHFNPPASIHLNDLPPSHFEEVFSMAKCTSLMVGGAGKAFEVLFSDYDTFFPLLLATLKKHPSISEVVLDVEEPTSSEDLNRLIADLEGYDIAMSPCSFALTDGGKGLGGFDYHDIKGCSRFYVQAYSPTLFTYDMYIRIKRLWPEQEIVMGCLASTVPLKDLVKVTEKMPSVALWDVGASGGQDWVRAMEMRNLVQWSSQFCTNFERRQQINMFWRVARERSLSLMRLPKCVANRILSYLFPGE